MQIELISQSHKENISEFHNMRMKRNWDILIIVLDGTYSIQPVGRKKPFYLQKNEIAFIPSSTEFEREVISPLTYYHISFRAQGDHPFRMGLPISKLSIPKEQVIPIVNSMEHAFPMPDNRELITHIIERIFAENYLFGKSKRVNLPHLSEEILSTIRYMNAHLSESLSMDELAARVYLSHTGLIWKFHRELGCTPQQYLISLRIRLAKQLLLESDLPIAQIAQRCGYANAYYFSNAFRTCTGISPSAFRRQTYSQKNT
jgi:AraC-like DNA-binding protein